MVGGLEFGGEIEDGVDGIAGAVRSIVLQGVDDGIEAVEAAVDVVLAREAEGAAVFAGDFADRVRRCPLDRAGNEGGSGGSSDQAF